MTSPGKSSLAPGMPPETAPLAESSGATAAERARQEVAEAERLQLRWARTVRSLGRTQSAEEAAALFDLTVHSMVGGDGASVILRNISARKTVEELRARIHAEMGVEPDEQRLFVMEHGQKPLEDETLEIGAYDVREGVTLHVAMQDGRSVAERRAARAEARAALAAEAAARAARTAARKAAAKKVAKVSGATASALAAAAAIVYVTAGCGNANNTDCDHGSCVGLASATCECEDNFVGEDCESSCAPHGTSDNGLSCTCRGNFIGEFCDADCGCSGHGEQTALASARAAGSCAAGSCRCSGNWAGEFCEGNCGANGTSDGTSCTCAGHWSGEFCDYMLLNNETAPPQCRAGMGSHGVVISGKAYRMLDGADPAGNSAPDEAAACQCADADGNGRCDSRPSDYLEPPAGWSVAPNDAESIAAIAIAGWGTSCGVLADGSGWRSANAGDETPGDRCSGDGYLETQGAAYTVDRCPSRVLLRCP